MKKKSEDKKAKVEKSAEMGACFHICPKGIDIHGYCDFKFFNKGDHFLRFLKRTARLEED